MAGFLNHYPPYPVNMPPRTADMFSPMVAPPYGKSEDLNFIFRHERTHARYVVGVAIVQWQYELFRDDQKNSLFRRRKFFPIFELC